MLKKIGLENCTEFISGAAPLKSNVRNFFMGLGVYINNLYGLSETTGAISGLMPG